MQGLPFSLGLFCVKIKMNKNFKEEILVQESLLKFLFI